MQFDIRIVPSNQMRADADLILSAERWGFAGAWVAEQAGNPFFPLTIAAKETSEIQLGVYRAAAFPRSPMVSAQIAWDLARQSNGRFRLGLGWPADSDNTDSSDADHAGHIRRMREYVESLRAIWQTFQTDARLRYRGEFYTFRLMAPFFNPGPIEHPNIPLFLAAMTPEIAELAGRLCQGLHVSAIHTASYLREAVKPAVAAGLKAAGRAENDFTLAAPVMIASGADEAGIDRERRKLKMRIAAAASTLGFRRVAAHHGWDLRAEDLNQLTRGHQKDSLDQLIPDEIVAAIAIVAPLPDVVEKINERYAGLTDRVSLELNCDNRALIEAIISCRSAGR